MTDNRTSEPTEAQVEAAAKILADRDDYSWEHIPQQGYLDDARAALVAAAGVAPQAESVPTSKYINPNLPGMIRNLWKSDPSENSVRTALKLAGDLIQELIDLRAAPVQLSSTVDEATVRQRVATGLVAAGIKPHDPAYYRAIDAVVEAIRGEGR